jgi:hypothetical protein
MEVNVAKKNLKTSYKKLRLTEFEAEQIDEHLKKHELTFTDFVNTLISRAILSTFPSIPREEEFSSEIFVFQKKKSKSVRSSPKVDPELLFQVGKIGNNINQIAKALNAIKQDQQLKADFSFLECLHTLSLIQSDLHEVMGELPKIHRSEDAVQKAYERALAKVQSRKADNELTLNEVPDVL